MLTSRESGWEEFKPAETSNNVFAFPYSSVPVFKLKTGFY
jgi:hypothetical protein